MFTMTKEEALAIQAKQIAHYSHYRPDLAQAVAALTTADNLESRKPYPVSVINEHIPRGGDIEHLCGISNSAQI